MEGHLDPKTSLVPIPDESLPNVLLIGDSISIGYTPLVQAKLKGIANVYRPMKPNGIDPENCMQSSQGVKRAQQWVEGKKWAVIHFNFGLHDLKYLDAKGGYVTPDKGKQVATPTEYANNLTEIIQVLQKTGAHLVWATTTPVPEGSRGRVKGDEVPFNQAAESVMLQKGVAIDDLCAIASSNISAYQKPHDVHFTEAGYEALAESVAKSIQTSLQSQSTK